MKYLSYLFITCIGALSAGCGGTRVAVSEYEMDHLEKNKVKPSELVDAHQTYLRTNGDNPRREGTPVQFFLLPDTTSDSKVTVPVIKLSSEENQEGWTLYDNTKCVVSAATKTTMTVEVKCEGDDCGLRLQADSLPDVLPGDDTLHTFRLVTAPIPSQYGDYIEIDGEQVECVGIFFDAKTYICTRDDWMRVYGEIKVKEKKRHAKDFKPVKDKKVKRRVHWPWSP